MSRKFTVVVAVALAALLAACVGQAPMPTTGVVTITATVMPSAISSPLTAAILPVSTLTATPTTKATVTILPTSTLTATTTSTAPPMSTPTGTATPTVTPSPTPHPLAGYTIEGLRTRDYPGGTIELRAFLTTTEAYTRYSIVYPSDDLHITGVMHVPLGEGPFPVVILNHGYIPPARYWSGADTWRAADYLARRGYLTIAPDFRGWGGSDSGDNFFHSGLVIDVLNLISSLPSVPQADPQWVGMWGHSMGGGVTTKAITIDRRIKAAVLYAPVSADDMAVMRRWGRWIRGGELDDPLWQSYRQAARDRAFLQRTSPISHFDLVTAPVQVHQGTADTTTPLHWAEAIHDALLAAGKEVEYYAYEGQCHAFQGESWVTFMQRVVAFFGRYVKGK